MIFYTYHGAPKSLWVITTYFNWTHVRSKRANYEIFSAALHQADINLLTVECALLGQPFELHGNPHTIQVRTDSVLWQKERLLNIALEYLPCDCRIVCWIDADLLFHNPKWATQAAARLERYGVVQLFDTVVRQPQHLTRDADLDYSITFAPDYVCDRPAPGTSIYRHPGYAWAAHRDLLEACDGFFDQAIVGGADLLMAHAWIGDFHSRIARHVAMGALWPHFEHWAARAAAVVKGSLSHIRGTVTHLWHGDTSNRLYLDRHVFLNRFRFDPARDLTKNVYGCWSWATENRPLREWMQQYFNDRREDG